MKQANVLFVYRRNRVQRRAAKQCGEGPDEMLYGLDLLPPERFAASFIEDDPSKRSLFRWLWRPLEKTIARLIAMGFAMPMIRENLGALARADIIVSTVDTCGLPLAMLRYQGKLKAPLIYISQGLTDRFARLPLSSVRRRLFTRWYGRYLHAADRVVVFGYGAVQPLIDLFGLPDEKVVCVPFGIDTEFWYPALAAPASSAGKILSIGSDPSRDYRTLLMAAGDELNLHIVTRTALPPTLLGENTTVSTDHTDTQLRELYQRSAFVVTPLEDVAQPSGQSATLQAMACGKAVILTQTRGLWEPDRLINEGNCLLVNPGDVQGLRAAMSRLLEHPDEAERIGKNARQTVQTHCASQHLAKRLAVQIEEVLAAASRHGNAGYA